MLKRYILFWLFIFSTSFHLWGVTWGPSQVIGGGDVRPGDLQLITDSQGKCTAIWYDNNNNNLFFSQKPLGGTWSTGASISTTTTLGIANSNLVVDGFDNVYVATSTFADLYVATLPAGTSTWSVTNSLDNSIDGVTLPIYIASNAVGDLVVAYRPGLFTLDGTVKAIVKYKTDASWSSPVSVSAAANAVTVGGLTMDSNGIATLSENIVVDQGVNTYILPFHSTWSGATLLSTNGVSAGDSALELDPTTQNVNAIWVQSPGGNFEVFTATSVSGTNVWTTPLQISQSGGTVNNNINMGLAVENNGNATAAWTQTGDGNIYSAYRIAGTWSTPAQITTTGNVQDLAMATGGGTTTIIYGFHANFVLSAYAITKTSTAGTFNTPVLLETQSNGDNSSISVTSAVDPYGNSTATWEFYSCYGDYNNTATNSASTLLIPVVTNVNPNSGSVTGGDTITITGVNFTNATAVDFGNTAATSFIIVSPTEITAVSPAGSVGTVDVTVTNTDGTSSVNIDDEYTYTSGSGPTISNVNPNTGPIAGTNTVIITGTGFTGATSVMFGTTAAGSFNIDSSTQITAAAPAGTAGTVDVRVTTPSGTTPITAADHYTYFATPTVTNVNPNSGPTGGTNSVVITGTNFTGATAVMFGTIAATTFAVNSPTQITATAPAGAAGTVDVTVTTPGGTSAITNNDHYTYFNAPTVTNVNPNVGPTGGTNSVVITGTNFTGATAVMFGATAATTFVVNSPTQITATAPAGAAGTVDVTVTTPGGTSAITNNDHYTYFNAPTVTNVNPNVGPTGGTNSVVITGTNFTGTTGVLFGTTAATTFAVNSPTQITATAPAGAAGTVDVTVTTPGGTSAITNNDHYTYLNAPTVTNVNPNVGPTGGTNSVVITGTNFTGSTAVMFGTTAATTFAVNSPTQITATAPAGAAGTVDVTVTTPGGTSAVNTNDHYTYLNAPTVTNVNPNSGPTGGTNSVVITGTNFTGSTAVMFGTTAATTFAVNSPTQITATAPAGTAGTIDVTVTTPGGTSAVNTNDHYTYFNAPTVTNVNPNTGPTGGTNSVVITGTNFTGSTAVMFGTTAATTFAVNSPTQITATAPAGTAGTIDVTVTTPGGTSAVNTNDHYTYFNAPTVTNVNPNTGPTGGTNSVIITGTNFTGSTAVMFGTTAATTFAVNSPTQITATAPAGTAGTIDVTVTTPGGTSAVNTNDHYTYFNAPTVTNVNPNTGPTGGTNSVVITGTNFTGSTAVMFGTTAATTFAVNSPTQITATAPAGAAGTVDVTVTTPGGTSAVNTNDHYTYLNAPTVTNVNPNVGPTGGTNSVVITGTNFTGTTGVLFGTTAASTFTIDSPTQITATAPAGTAGTVDVKVTTPGGTSAVNTNDHYTYLNAPTVTSISPNIGAPAGGNTVIITGTNFTGATGIMFGTVIGSFVINSPTQITATAPAGTVGTVDVTVTSPGGTSAINTNDHYTYAIPIPTITSATPNTGTPAGGNSVVITGTNFTNTSVVDFGNAPSPSFVVNSPTQITAVSPAGSLGTVDITVTTPGGTSTTNPNDEFTYVSGPEITNLSIHQGSFQGGTEVGITGINFFNVAHVFFGGTSVLSFTVDSPTQITAIAPAGSIGDTVNVTITTASGASPTTPADEYQYVAPVVNPPTNVTGVQSVIRFLTQRIISNTISWNPPIAGAIPTSYRIYSNSGLTNLIASVPATQLSYEIANIAQGSTTTYYIVSVFGGVISTPVAITITPSNCST